MTKENKSQLIDTLLWVAMGTLVLGLLFARAAFPETLWITIALAVPLLGVLGALIQRNRKALRSRTAAFGFNSAVTVLLVVAIVGVLNFLSVRFPLKGDLTKNRIHTFSDQTVKLIKGLDKPLKATLFSKVQQREQFRPLLENYKSLSPKFELEYADPDKEPTRAKQLGIKKYGTLHLAVGTRESKIEDINEEKITNALIKLLKEKAPTFCAVTGHGEKNFNSTEAEGYDAVKKALGNQSYELKEVSLTEAGGAGKQLESCDAIAIIGPTKAYFAPEVKAIAEYLDNGGRALIALDVNLKGGDFVPELLPVLETWKVKPTWGIIVDPVSRMLGVDAAVPVIATYSKESPVTREFQMNSFFPFVRPLDIVPGAPEGLKVQWIAQSTPKSWGVTDPKQLTSGQVQFNPERDKSGPLNVAIAVDGKQKDSKATRATRMVVFGSSYFGTNNYVRFGGNLDFFMNAASWLMEDEALISIRAKEEGPGKVELSEIAGRLIFLITVIALPLLVAVAGIVIWVRRRKL